MTNYFVDCYNGSDAAAGTSWATAWRTLDKAILSIPALVAQHNCYIAPGFYRLETRNKPQVWDYQYTAVRIIGLGGVVIDSVDHTAGFHKGQSGGIWFYNVVLKPNTVFCDFPAYNTSIPTINFSNCDLHNGSIVLGTFINTEPQMQFRYCSFQGPLPAIPSTISADIGPFRVIAPVKLYSGSVQENCVVNKVSNDQGFLLNADLPAGASVILPSAAQYDTAGPSFVTGDLLPDGLSQRFTLGVASTPQQLFSGWVVDPTGPAGTVTKTDDYGITLAAGDGVRCLSPVLHYGMGLSLTRILMTATEFGFGGFNQVIDSTPADATRTLEYRVSDTPFTQTELSPAWNTVTRNVDIPAVRGKYFQFRITFNLEAM